MKFSKNLLIVVAMILCLIGFSQELLKNGNFNDLDGNNLKDWQYQKNKTKPIYIGKKGVLTLKSENVKNRAVAIQSISTDFPDGTIFTITGEYRTKNLIRGKGGAIFTNIKFNNSLDNKKFPIRWFATHLKNSEKWKKFKNTKKIDVTVKKLNLYLTLWECSGEIEFKNISLKATLPQSEIKKDAIYFWKEAEDIAVHLPTNRWGAKISKDYFSGKGGVFFENNPMIWRLSIAPETDQKTLFNKVKTYHLWARVYGYNSQDYILFFHNQKYVNRTSTPANEVVDEKGKYVSPGKYVWVYLGEFSTDGGSQTIKILPKGRMLADSLILTTDKTYRPIAFEARDIAQPKGFTEIKTKHIIMAEFQNWGVSDIVTSVLSFRIAGVRQYLSKDAKPAVFHVALPKSINVKGVSSHFANEDWGSTLVWKNRKLTWKLVGSKVVDNEVCNLYEVYLYALTGNQYFIFVQANPKDFKINKTYKGQYYLEHGKEKQIAEKILIKGVKITQTKSFKKIHIGGAGSPFLGFYYGFKDIFDTMKKTGLNAMEVWGFYQANTLSYWREFSKKCAENDIMFYGQMSPFYYDLAPKGDERAIDKNGNYIKNNGHSCKPSLALDESSECFKKITKYIENLCSTGVNAIVLDDESFNQIGDLVDYSPKTKELFKKYLKDIKSDVEYIDPLEIVNNKSKYKKLYDHWINFKCERVASWYKIYRDAMVKGLEKAGNNALLGKKPILITHIQGAKAKNATIIKETNFFDYKKLLKHCDYINTMAYTYSGVPESNQIGDFIEMYWKYTKEDKINPTLLCDYDGSEISLENKPMQKYQIFEALMQKSRLILFWMTPGMMNALNLKYISEAIALTVPYEDFFINGQRDFNTTAEQSFIRVKSLKLGSEVLIYVTNYQNSTSKIAKINSKYNFDKIIEITDNNKVINFNKNSFQTDFKKSRGRLFLGKVK